MTVLIIPAKPLNRSKSRLAPVLAPEERIRLSRYLLQRTVRLGRQAGQVVVVSADRAVRRLAKQAGAWALVELEPGLNGAIRQAVRWVKTRGGSSVLVLPADLPYLTVADLRRLIELGRPAPAVVVAPCHRHSGTNALLLSPPDVILPAFGQNSFSRHMRAAQRAGLDAKIYRSDTVAFDLDLPEDLAALANQAELLSG